MGSSAIRLAVIGGDGIGPEVVAEALKVLKAAAVTGVVSDDRGRKFYSRIATTRGDQEVVFLAVPRQAGKEGPEVRVYRIKD